MLRPARTCRICPWRCPSRPSSPGHWPDVNQINIQILLSKLDRETCIFLLMASISKQWVRILGQGALLSEVLARQCCWRHEKDIFEGTETWKTPPTHPPTHSPVKQENAPWFRRLEGYSTLHMNHIINWHFSAQPGFISLSIAPHMLSSRNQQSSIFCPPMKATSWNLVSQLIFLPTTNFSWRRALANNPCPIDTG